MPWWEKHRLRKEVFEEMNQYLKVGEKILKNARERLGEEDPVSDRFKTAIAVLLNAHNDIQSFVEKGEVIEDF
jgi:hypothetical protein